MKKVVFLDRDGILIRERGDYTWQLEDVTINSDVAESLQLLAASGFEFIVISNQSGIAKGLYTKAEADYIHLHISRYLLVHGIEILEYYYCPHHPSVSECLCRKPDSLLLEKAIARFRIDTAQSWFIGDADRDEEAGIKAGVRPIRVEANSPLLGIAERIVKTKV